MVSERGLSAAALVNPSRSGALQVAHRIRITRRSSASGWRGIEKIMPSLHSRGEASLFFYPETSLLSAAVCFASADKMYYCIHQKLLQNFLRGGRNVNLIENHPGDRATK